MLADRFETYNIVDSTQLSYQYQHSLLLHKRNELLSNSSLTTGQITDNQEERTVAKMMQYLKPAPDSDSIES